MSSAVPTLSVSLNMAALCKAVFPSLSTASISTPNFERGVFPPMLSLVGFVLCKSWLRLRAFKRSSGLHEMYVLLTCAGGFCASNGHG